MNVDLESLGISKEDLENRLLDRLCKEFTVNIGYDEDNCEYELDTVFGKKLKEIVQKRVDKVVGEIAEKHVLPNVANYIETTTLQKTNEWGEARGKSVTFIEYLVQRAEEYLIEPVDFDGRSQSERRGYSWSKSQTRIAHMIHEHLQYGIETAMKNALKTANGKIVEGIESAVRIKLNEVAESLKVSVKTK